MEFYVSKSQNQVILIWQLLTNIILRGVIFVGNRLSKEKGFTLIEVIVVISIITIFAALAVPSIISINQRAKNTVTVTNARTIATGINAHNQKYEADPDRIISALPDDFDTLASSLGLLCPKLSEDEAADAMELISISNNIATVDKSLIEPYVPASASPSSTSLPTGFATSSPVTSESKLKATSMPQYASPFM